MAKINKTKYALLGVLNIMSGSGYDIKKFCDSSLANFWNENYGHIYPVLQRMLEEELITKKTVQSEGNRTKNIYSITQKGRIELQNWLVSPVEGEPIRSEFLLKIFLSKNIPIKNIIEKIETVKEKSEKRLQEYSIIEDMMKSEEFKEDKKTKILYLSTVNFGKKKDEAIINWCEETLEALNEVED